MNSLSANRQPAERRADAAAPAARALPRDDFDRDVWCVLGIPVDMTTTAEAVLAIETAARDRRRLSFVTPNVNWLVRAARDEHARRQIVDADLSLADGAPLVLLARLLGAPIRERAAGADVFEALRLRPGFAGRRLKVFFFGGRDGSAQAASRRVNEERGGVESVGWKNPGFGDVAAMSGPETIGEINATRPDFVVVALGAAKGQDWIEANAPRLEAPVLAHLGAVVDFTGGAVRRAPNAISRIGLEWLWRIFADPGLWRRYALDGVRLVRLSLVRVLPQLMIGRPNAGERAAARLETEGGSSVVRLAGVLAGDLGEVRAAFRAVAAAASDEVVLDFSAVEDADRAFLGQVLMLEKALRPGGGAIRVRGHNPRLAALFRANAMTYAGANEADARRASAAAPHARGAAA